MPSAKHVYAREVHKQWGFYGTWLPGAKIKVGDVGTLRNSVFTREGHLKDYGITAPITIDSGVKAQYQFASKGVKDTAVSGAGSGPAIPGVASAALNIEFSSERAVYFRLEGCVGSAVKNLTHLGQEILALVRNEMWPLEYVVVTRLVTAGSATVIQSSSANASIRLEANGASPIQDALRVKGGVRSAAGKEIGFSMIAEGNVTPLMGLGKVKYTILDKVFHKKPKNFDSDTMSEGGALSRWALPAKSIRTVAAALQPVRVMTAPARADYLGLNVRLKKDDDFVDLAPLLHFTDLAFPDPEDITVGSVRDRVFRRPKTVVMPAKIAVGSLHSLVGDSDHISILPESKTAKYLDLEVRLPKSAKGINCTPLVELTGLGLGDAEDKHSVAAELTFGEI